MLKCRDVAAQIDAMLAGELPLFRRLFYRLHITLCGHCRNYVKQYRQMLASLPTVNESATDTEVEQVLKFVERSHCAPGAHRTDGGERAPAPE